MRKFFLAILTAAIFSIGISAYHHARVGARPPEHPRAYDRKPPAPATRDDYAYQNPRKRTTVLINHTLLLKILRTSLAPILLIALKDNRIQTLLIALKASPALTPPVVLNTSPALTPPVVLKTSPALTPPVILKTSQALTLPIVLKTSPALTLPIVLKTSLALTLPIILANLALTLNRLVYIRCAQPFLRYS